jgi:hypothetical protein
MGTRQPLIFEFNIISQLGKIDSLLDEAVPPDLGVQGQNLQVLGQV